MMRAPYFLLVFFFPFCFIQGQVIPFISEKSLSPDKKYSVQYWTTDNGLPQNSVNSIAQTQDGYLWLATYDGLVQFDGIKFHTYNSSNTSALKTSGIRRLYVDHADRLWMISTEGALVSFRNGVFTPYDLPHKIDYIKNTIVSYKDDVILICGDNKLCKLSNNRFEPTQSPVFKKIFCIESTRDLLFVGTDRGLWRYDGKTWLNMPGFENMGMSQLYVAPNKDLLVDAEYNLYWVRGLNKIQIPINFDLKPLHEYKIGFNENGQPVLLCEQGLWTLNDPGFIKQTTEDGLSTSAINSYFVDRDKNIWVGTNNGGLNRLKPKLFKTYSKEDGMFDDGVTAITQSKSGSIYIGNNCQGTSEFLDGKFFYRLPQLKNDICSWSVMEDNFGQLWVGTYGGGVSIYRKNGTIDNYRIPAGLPDNVIFSIYQDSKGRVWIGTANGLGLYTKGTFSILDTVFHNKVTHIIEINNSEIWLCTDKGLAHVQGNNVVYPNKDMGLKEGACRYLYEDEAGILWVGTSGNGLLRIKNGKAFYYSTFTSQLDKNVWSILEDKQGNLWMPSNTGMFVASKKELNDFADGKTRTLGIAFLSKEDGLKSLEFNGGFQPSALQAHNGKLWFPTVKGVAQADPSLLQSHQQFPQVVIERLAIDDSLTNSQDTLSVSSTVQNISIFFTAPFFTNPSRLCFQYLIEGLDKEWNSLGDLRELKLNHIPDGMHRIRIRVAGDNNPHEASIVIYKPIPLWKRLEFQALAAILFITLVLVITLTYVRIVRNREKRKTELHKEYASIELRALQSQLNPHFIFNCLNSIQHFILANDEKAAMKYLTKFSSLMRMFLEHSKSNTVTLQQECELLKLYVEIESLRFKNGFDFKLEVDEQIDAYNIQIPSMLFQPFVENAIKHGLLNLDRKGTLRISFSIKDNELIGIVDDDGVGRQRAKEMESREHDKHQSRGMEITADRIETINYIENTHIVVEIEDKMNGNQAAGTRITIKIPI